MSGSFRFSENVNTTNCLKPYTKGNFQRASFPPPQKQQFNSINTVSPRIYSIQQPKQKEVNASILKKIMQLLP